MEQRIVKPRHHAAYIVHAYLLLQVLSQQIISFVSEGKQHGQFARFAHFFNDNGRIKSLLK